MFNVRKAFGFFAFAVIVCGLIATKSVTASTVYVTTTGSNANVGYGPANPRLTITEAVSDAVAGDSINVGVGMFNEMVNVNKRLVIMGAGSGPAGTIIAFSGGGLGGVIQLSASGLVGSPIVFKDLRVQNTGMAGFSVGTMGGTTGTNLSYINFDNVYVVGTNLNPGLETERGLYVDLTSSLHWVNITNCAFNNQHYGWYFHKQVSADASTVDNINVISTQFNSCSAKGIYVEKLSQAVFNDCQVVGSGYELVFYNVNFNAGFDINLKAGIYSNLQFLNCTFANNALGAKEGVGLTVKGRDDASSYNTFPATVSGVTVDFCRFTGNERAVRFGEPGKNNLGPLNVVVKNCSFVNNLKTYVPMDGSAYGDVLNQSQASVDAKNNWWNSAVEAYIMSRIYGTVIYSPWLLHDTGDFLFNLAFNPIKPRVTDTVINIELKIQKMGDSISGIQFDMVVPRNSLVYNGVTTTLYTTAGAVTTQMNVSKNIISTTATTLTYRFALTPSNVNSLTDRFHMKIPGDTSRYTTMKLSFATNGTAMIGDNIDFTIMNIAAQEINGAPIRATLNGTRIVRTETISHRFKATGDINNSGSVNVQDLMLIINHILQIAYLNGPQFQEADLNRDAIVNIADAMLLLQIINGNAIPGAPGSDFNPLVIETMPGNNSFQTKNVWALYFTSIEPMTWVTGLERATKVLYNADKTAMTAEFSSLSDCEVSFGANNTVTGNRIGWANLALGVEEELEDLGVTNGDITIPAHEGASFIAIYSADGQLVHSSAITQDKFTYQNHNTGAYYYSVKTDKKLVTGKFMVIK